MCRLSISLLGRFSVRREAEIVEGLDCHKVQELISYLLIFRDSVHPREVLAGALWGGSSTAQSRTYLRKALWQIQVALDQEDPRDGSASFLIVENDWVRANPCADICVDAAVLDRSFALVEGKPGEQLNSQEADAIQHAVALYQGDLLAGSYADWCLTERERFQNMYLALLDKLMGYCEANRCYEHGLIYGGLALRCDRAREQIHRRLMRLHFKNGDRTAALRQFMSCTAALEAELGVRPSEQTIKLYEQVKLNRLSDGAPPDWTAGLEHPATARLNETLDRLERYRALVTQFQSELQAHLHNIDRLLQGSPRA